MGQLYEGERVDSRRHARVAANSTSTRNELGPQHGHHYVGVVILLVVWTEAASLER